MSEEEIGRRILLPQVGESPMLEFEQDPAVKSQPSAGQFPHAVGAWRESRTTTARGHLTLYRRIGKRLFDASGAALGLLLTSPLLLVCAVAARLDSAGPIFFRQRRIGQGGKPFEIIKFRTMVQHPDKNGLKITVDGDSRITTIGKGLRKLKLDELPQLFNVLTGEMSLVGPRPEVPEYVAAYNSEQMRVLEVKAGITGPSSLAYINEEAVLRDQDDPEKFYVERLMPRKLDLDLAYCEKVTFLGDMKLILATLSKLIKRK
jgi:lipopolysaccharide/colanic/teichoic acid biosynthesis glycosyltransferase